MPTLKGNLSTPIENYVWEWPDLTVSELRQFVERDFGKYLVDALRDVGMVLGFRGWRAISVWLGWAEGSVPQEMKERLLYIDAARLAALQAFPSLDRIELDVARREIVEVMTWLRAEFPAAGIEHLPGDFGS